MVYSVTPTGFGHKGSGGNKTDLITNLTDARWQGEQALFTTAVAMLTERPALPDDLAGLVARLRYEQQGAEFSNRYADLVGEAANAIEALAAREPKCAVVKPLVWVRSDYSSRSECGNYHGLHCESGFWASMGAREITSTSETREEFEAAAQADAEARILTAINLRHEAEVRAEAWTAALNEVARRADEASALYYKAGNGQAGLALSLKASGVRSMIASTPDDISAALDRIKAEAKAEWMREAAQRAALMIELGFEWPATTRGKVDAILDSIPEVRK